jgi:membrane-associated phospholipid phosphatase
MDGRLEGGPVGEPSPGGDPAVSTASPSEWRTWLTSQAQVGMGALARLGLVLVVGFVLGVVALLGFSHLASEVMERETESIDLAALAWLRQLHSPALDTLARIVSALGSEVLVALLVGLLVLFVLQRRWGAAVSLLLVWAGAQLLNNLLKDFYQRARPEAVTAGLLQAQAYSFPSGHAMVSAAFYGYLAYLSWRVLNGWKRVAATVFLVLLVLLIGLSRMYLGVHYLTDVVAGYVAGFVWTDAVILAGRFLARGRGRTSAEKHREMATSGAPARSGPATRGPARSG